VTDPKLFGLVLNKRKKEKKRKEKKRKEKKRKKNDLPEIF
jgi:hypothetical protein